MKLKEFTGLLEGFEVALKGAVKERSINAQVILLATDSSSVYSVQIRNGYWVEKYLIWCGSDGVAYWCRDASFGVV